MTAKEVRTVILHGGYVPAKRLLKIMKTQHENREKWSRQLEKSAKRLNKVLQEEADVLYALNLALELEFLHEVAPKRRHIAVSDAFQAYLDGEVK